MNQFLRVVASVALTCQIEGKHDFQLKFCSILMAAHIFILKLTDDCYFVDRSSNVQDRIQDFFQGRGSYWTQIHKPIAVVSIFQSKCPEERDMWTKKLMRIHSIDRVRGGSYSHLDLTPEERRFIENEIRGANDQCFECGQLDHFDEQCPSRGYQAISVIRQSGFLHLKKVQVFNGREVDMRRIGREEGSDMEQNEYNAEQFENYFQIGDQSYKEYWNQLQFGSGLRRQADLDHSSSRHRVDSRGKERSSINENSQEESSEKRHFIKSPLGSFIVNDSESLQQQEYSSQFGLSLPSDVRHPAHDQEQSQLPAQQPQSNSHLQDLEEQEILRNYLVQPSSIEGQNKATHARQPQYQKWNQLIEEQSEDIDIRCIRKRRKRPVFVGRLEGSSSESLTRLRKGKAIGKGQVGSKDSRKYPGPLSTIPARTKASELLVQRGEQD